MAFSRPTGVYYRYRISTSIACLQLVCNHSSRVSESVTSGHNAPGRHPLSVGRALVGRAATGYTAAVLAWQTLAEAEAPDGQRLQLRRRGQEFLIRAGGFDLMSSRDDVSARALATIGCAALLDRDRQGRRVLIGGLGMGFSLAAACVLLPSDAEIEIAELVAAVIEWNRGPLAELAGRPLDDPRVRVQQVDVAQLIERAHAAYDAILLDVDNGPSGLVRAANDGLYSKRGLALAKAALKPGGILAIWSAAPDAAFSRRLKDAGFKVDEVTVRARSNGKGPRHIIWFAGV
jgi:spermidine synthase